MDMQTASRWESERMPSCYARGQHAGRLRLRSPHAARGASARFRYGA